MMTFCPFFNAECKGNQCVMWSNEECLIVGFLERLQVAFPMEPIEEDISIET